jgi:hypothetical protein
VKTSCHLALPGLYIVKMGKGMRGGGYDPRSCDGSGRYSNPSNQCRGVNLIFGVEHSEKKPLKDPGVELGQHLFDRCCHHISASTAKNHHDST